MLTIIWGQFDPNTCFYPLCHVTDRLLFYTYFLQIIVGTPSISILKPTGIPGTGNPSIFSFIDGVKLVSDYDKLRPTRVN